MTDELVWEPATHAYIAKVVYRPHPVPGGGGQLLIRLTNGYLISVIRGFFTFGVPEMAVRNPEGLLMYMEAWNDEVYRTNDAQDLFDLIRKVGEM